jgi:tetratricopeptide (TPR) repeat protein
MRRAAASAVVVLSLLVALSPAWAKFGASKTRVSLRRQRPPDLVLGGTTVAVDVTSDARTVTRSHLGAVRGEVEDALRAAEIFEVIASPKEADSVVTVSVEELVARVRESVNYEDRYVKVGERQEWDSKRQKMVTRDVYGYRKEPVPVRRASGHVSARVEVETRAGRRDAVDINIPYESELKGEVGGPVEGSSEEALERHLIERLGQRAAAAVVASPETVPALLAVDGELKPGNRLAEAGEFESALAEWSRRPLKGDKEAARLHNLGVAHEALAYRLPPDDPEHQARLEKASEHYRKALALDPGEKYFAEPIERIGTSLEYAERARQVAAARVESRTSQAKSSSGPAARTSPARVAGPASPSSPVSESSPGSRSSPPSQSSPSAAGSAGVPLRNGSFESSLTAWTVRGRGGVPAEAGRGRVLELSAGTAAAEAAQDIDLDVSRGATLTLDYKVVAGEPPLRIMLRYDDAQGRPRSSTLEVSAGESPGGWDTWQTDLSALRPRPARLTELRVTASGGTIRLDDIRLEAR